jgi:hypothetical protein
MTTIRQLIEKTMEFKAQCCNISVDEAFKTSLSVVFYSRNGVEFFIVMHPNYNKLKKNNVYRKIDINIMKGDYKAPQEIWNFGSIWTNNVIPLARFYNMPEKMVNEFMLMNGGIDIDRFISDSTTMWKSLG